MFSRKKSEKISNNFRFQKLFFDLKSCFLIKIFDEKFSKFFQSTGNFKGFRMRRLRDPDYNWLHFYSTRKFCMFFSTRKQSKTVEIVDNCTKNTQIQVYIAPHGCWSSPKYLAEQYAAPYQSLLGAGHFGCSRICYCKTPNLFNPLLQFWHSRLTNLTQALSGWYFVRVVLGCVSANHSSVKRPIYSTQFFSFGTLVQPT